MILNLYAIKDTKGPFTQPIVYPNDEFALRAFIAAVRSSQPNTANTFPEDKQFFRVGTYDDENGKLVSDVKLIACASNYVVEHPATVPVVQPVPQEVPNAGSNESN